MRRFGLAVALALVPALAGASGQDMWTWTDVNGVVHYTNLAEFAPSAATNVGARITVEVDKIPGANEEVREGSVEEGYDPFPADRRHRFPITNLDDYDPIPFDDGNEYTEARPPCRLHDSFGEHLGGSKYGGTHFRALPDAPRVYDESRLKFGCYSGGVLWAGGFSHAGDISGVQNCYAYRLGPEAWLNTARAELAMRQNGINPRDMMKLYMEEWGGR